MSLTRTALLTSAPKIAAVARDFLLISHYGMGAEVAALTSLLVAVQFISSAITPGVQAVAIAHARQLHTRFDRAISIIAAVANASYLLVYLHTLESDQISKTAVTYALTIITAFWATAAAISSAHLIARERPAKYDALYALDALPSIAVITLILFTSTFQANDFLLGLCAAFVIISVIYKRAENKINAKTPEKNKISPQIVTALRISIFVFAMSSTNIIDQVLLSKVSMADLSLYNIVQRYTFVVAGMALLILTRQYARTFASADVSRTLIRHHLTRVAPIFALLGAASLFPLSLSYPAQILLAAASATVQLPFYVALSLYLLQGGTKVSLADKLLAAAAALTAKYAFLALTGVTVNSIFISHAILNATAFVCLYIRHREHAAI